MKKESFKIVIKIVLAVLITALVAGGVFYLIKVFNKDYNSYEGNSPSNINNMGIAAQEDGHIYYSKFDAGYKIFKYNIKKQTEKVVYTADARYINVLKGQIYYIDSSNSQICAVSTQGTDFRLLHEGMSSHLYVTKDAIYFRDKLSNNNIYKMDLDGSNVTLIADVNAATMYVYKNYVFYTDYGNNNWLYKIDLNSGQLSLVVDQHIVFYAIQDDIVYYTNTNEQSNIYKIDIFGGVEEKIEGMRGWYLAADASKQNLIYFKAVTGKLRRLNTVSMNQMTVSNVDCANINILDGFLVFENKETNKTHIVQTANGKSLIIY